LLDKKEDIPLITYKDVKRKGKGINLSEILNNKFDDEYKKFKKEHVALYGRTIFIAEFLEYILYLYCKLEEPDLIKKFKLNKILM
jgi:hypothetical protein